MPVPLVDKSSGAFSSIVAKEEIGFRTKWESEREAAVPLPAPVTPV